MNVKNSETAGNSGSKQAEKQDRRAEALRRNLLRRKEQLRERERRGGGADDGENT